MDDLCNGRSLKIVKWGEQQPFCHIFVDAYEDRQVCDVEVKNDYKTRRNYH